MSLRDILAIVLSSQEGTVIAAAEAMARTCEGSATALLYEIEPDPVVSVDPYVVSDVWARMLERARATFVDEECKLEAKLAERATPMSFRTARLPLGAAGRRAAVEARYADVSIMARPEDELRKGIFEGVLFGSGRPVLVAPPGFDASRLGKNIAIGWNASREAARALADAGPLLERAEKITILTVDAKPSWSGHGEAPGTDVAAHLARLGLKVDVRNADGLGREDNVRLLEECDAIGADLLVIGGYGRPRLQQIVFGGVTREIVTASPIPLFLSH